MSESKEDESGIAEELAIQLQKVKEEFNTVKRELEEIKKEVQIKNELETLDSPIMDFFSDGNKPLKITGIALCEGIWKNTIYTHDEIEKAAKDLVGKPILIEHGRTEEFKDNPVGKVTSSRYDPTLESLIFEALVENVSAKAGLLSNKYKAVSCSTWMEKKPINSGIKLGYDFKFAELSLVESPACDRAFIFHLEQLMKDKSLNSNQGNEIKEEKKMEYIFEVAPETEELSAEVKETLMALVEITENQLGIIELESLSELDALAKARRVVSYYYGYPGYYPCPYGYGEGKEAKYYPYRYPYKKPSQKSDEDAAKKKYYYYPYKYKYPAPKKEQAGNLMPIIEDPIPAIGPEEQAFLEKRFGKDVAGELMKYLNEYLTKKKEEKPKEEPKEDEDEEEEDLWSLDKEELKGKLVWKKNPKTKKFTVFEVPEKGLWKIKASFDSKKEAEDFIAAGGKEEKSKEKPKDEVCPECKKSPCECPEEKAAEEKDEHGCIVGKEEYDEKEKKCMPLPAEKMSAWTDCIGEQRKAGKSFKDAVKECKIKLKMEKAGKIVCPACKKEFKDAKELEDHWVKEHEKEYGKYGEKYPEKKAAESFKCPKCGKEFKDQKKLDDHLKECKEEGMKLSGTVEEPKKEPEKAPEEPKAELKKEEPKQEPAKVEEPKKEPAKEEPKKEEPKKEEPPKKLTVDDVKAAIEKKEFTLGQLMAELYRRK